MKRWLTLLHLIAVTLILFLGVRLFYLWLTHRLFSLPVETGSSESAEIAEKSPPLLSAYEKILERNLFKTVVRAVKDSDTASAAAGSPESTPLLLKLWGIALFGNGGGYAVIEDLNTRTQSLFRPGQKIQNATLQTVLKDRVLLNTNGREQVLKMEEPRSLPERVPPLSAVSAPAAGSTRQITLSRSQIDDAIQNINTLMTQIKIRPHFLNGKPDGLAVGGILADSIFSRMGLQNGDIILGVNGEKILSVDDALKLYQNIKSGSNVSVALNRAGKTETLLYQIE